MNPYTLDEIEQRGLEIYERLKPTLKPAENGRVIAIHIDSGDYATGRDSSEARQFLRRYQPQGQLLIMDIGLEPNYALAGRVLAGSAWCAILPPRF